jgi:hypothetical protein
MKLYHYSAEPFVLDPQRVYQQEGHEKLQMKPRGLWLSVESDDEESFGWRDWCEREEFGLSRLTHRTELILQPAHVLHLDSSAALLAFTRRYERTHDGFSFFHLMDWAAVAQDYRGLLIAPYDWNLRLDLHWYYAWDCASACIWDCSTLVHAAVLE